MGRQLVFWKYNDKVILDNEKVYEAICGEYEVEGLCSLPADLILKRVNEVFGDYEKLDEYNFESEKGSFTFIPSKQGVIFDCGLSTGFDELNKIIALMLEFDCPLYDPQINERFG